MVVVTSLLLGVVTQMGCGYIFTGIDRGWLLHNDCSVPPLVLRKRKIVGEPILNEVDICLHNIFENNGM